MRRIYYFTPQKYALDNLKEKHLKVSRFSKCNDPFEIAAVNLKNETLRCEYLRWLDWMGKKNGMLCFCRTWRNPVMWSHYADNHKGVCYGFDVHPEKFIDVRYVSERLYPNLTNENFLSYVGEAQMTELFATKFIHWSYEEEVRLLIEFSEDVSDCQFQFHPFSAGMKLKEVILGPKSEIKASEVEEAYTDNGIDIFISRLAFERFEVERHCHGLVLDI